MDNQHIPCSGGENTANGLSAIHEQANFNKGLLNGYCRKSICSLSALALACIMLVLSPISLSGTLSFIISFPFAQLGRGLRVLSLPGGVGNIVAIVLYVAVCLLPMLALALIRKKNTEDALLPLISIVLFVAMYHMINPGITRMTNIAPFEQMFLGGIIYSLLMAYGVIRILRSFNTATAHRLGRYIGIMLHLLNIVFVFAAFGFTFAQMLDAFVVFRAGNTVSGQHMVTTYVFIALQHIARALSYVLNIWVVFTVQCLHAALSTDPYSDKTLETANRVSRACVIALTASVLTTAAFNLLQLIFISRLYIVNSNINFPVVSILFVLGALLLTRYIMENKLLKEENDRFV